jgi:uncharacterized protein YecE (DUF72 family)
MMTDLGVGCSGFPKTLVQYAKTFRLDEVQQTFYQPPSLKTLERWRSQVPAEFEFTLKAWQLITHEVRSPTYRRLRERLSERERREAGSFRSSRVVMGAWQRTLECARALRSQIILFQCPASFVPSQENKANLRAFFGEIRRASPRTGWDGASPPGKIRDSFTCVWEPRGAWKAEEVRELCNDLGLVHGVDPFEHEATTAGLGYFRLHGRGGYRYRYTLPDFEALLEKVESRAPCYVLFNNISMWEDALRFVKFCSKRLA